MDPWRGQRGFDKALRKYLERAVAWGAVGGGLFLTAAAYSVYILPVVSFLLQLDSLPDAWGEAEAEAMRRLLPGPGSWCVPGDLHALRAAGCPKEFPDAERVSLASRLRVAHQEALPRGLAVAQRARRLRRWLADTEHVVRKGTWAHWFQKSFVLQLEGAVDHFARAGVTPADIETQLASGEMRPFRPCTALRVRRGFQRAAYAAIDQTSEARLEVRARHKLERWGVPQFPRIRAQRGIQVLRRLGQLLPPRAWSAVWRTLWNGWVTHRRWPDRPGSLNRCVFCGPRAADSIEHYATCPCIWAFARSRLGLARPATTAECLSCFLILDVPPRSAETAAELLARKALRTAAAYRVHCMVRHGRVLPGEAAREALQQSVRELVRGHTGANRPPGYYC